MREYRVGEIADLLGVSVDTARRLVDAGDIESSRTAGGQRVVEGAALAAYLASQPAGTEVESSIVQSARNRFAGIVTRVERDGVCAVVELRSGPHRVVSLMTAEAAEDLGLQPGDLAVAAVKATSVVVEVPPS